MPRHHVQHFEALRVKITRRDGEAHFRQLVAEALASAASSAPQLEDPLERALTDCVRVLGADRVADLNP